MHLVQAMDAVPEMRGVLCLFEGVCTEPLTAMLASLGSLQSRCCISALAWARYCEFA